MKTLERENQLLTNHLAMAATLLYRCAQTLAGRKDGDHPSALVVECETWFIEARNSLEAALRENSGASSTTAPVVEKSGEELPSPPVIPGWLRPMIVQITEVHAYSPYPDLFYKLSFGGTIPTVPHSTINYQTPLPNYFFTKP